jgi:uncharacterized protein (UPF0332 family)
LTPETALHLGKAEKLFAIAERLLLQGFCNDAARDANLAAYHAAQAYIVEHAGRAAKTHSGVHSQFAQLALHEPRIGEGMSGFLARAYRLKAVADYEFGEDAEIPLPRVEAAVVGARRFVDVIASLLKEFDKPGPPEGSMGG